MKKMNIKKIKPLLKLIMLYLVYILFTFGVVKICALCNAMDNITLIIGCTGLLAESVYLGFYFYGKKRWSVGKYIGYGFLFLIIGAIVLWVTWYLTSLLLLLGDLIFNLPNSLEGFNFDRAFLIYFILVQVNLFILYRLDSNFGDAKFKDNSNSGNEDDQT
ncbi:MAG: hypothetical protein K2G60_01055 [Oscillospiraceae bacterium]|nr:hypothetical protein [Oscillospiraceae bacterium]